MIFGDVGTDMGTELKNDQKFFHVKAPHTLMPYIWYEKTENAPGRSGISCDCPDQPE
jgi:hypothetical protein